MRRSLCIADNILNHFSDQFASKLNINLLGVKLFLFSIKGINKHSTRESSAVYIYLSEISRRVPKTISNQLEPRLA